MAKSTSGGRDWMEGVYEIFALLFVYLLSCLQGGQTASPRGRGVLGYQLVGNSDGDGTWKNFDEVFRMPCASDDLRIPPSIDPEGQHNVWPVDLLPAVQDPIENIDADIANADETDLNIWLAVAEVASLPRQIERDEANMMVRSPPVPSSVAESGVAPSRLVDEIATRGVLPQRIEDEVEAHAQAKMETEVAIEASPPGMLELITDVPSLPQFATASMNVPAGDLESNLEERMPVDHPEAHFQAKINKEEDVENVEVEEPHAEGMQ